MRRFLLLCLIGYTAAAEVGYNYQQLGQSAPVAGEHDDSSNNGPTLSNSSSSGATNSLVVGFDGFNSNADHNVNGNSYPNTNTNTDTLSSGYSESYKNDNYNIDTLNPSYSQSNGNTNQIAIDVPTAVNPPTPQLEYSKEFYSYAPADDDVHEQQEADHLTMNTVKKNVRVIFIKTPENNALTKAALQLVKQANEEHTAIYVLTKQTDIADLANKLRQQTSANSPSGHRPEVHFVKYRTPEDALRAQQIIQAQYDALGGTTQTSNESVAPVLDFSTQSGGNKFIGTQHAKPTTQADATTYFPAGFRLH